MHKLIRRAARLWNRRAGVSLVRTYLYGIAKPSHPATVKSAANVEWELLSPEGLDVLSEIGWFDAKEGLQRLQRGDLCYVASCDGRMAHYSWVQRSGSHPITEAGLIVPVQSGEFWIYDCLTVEWARGKWIYPEALERIVNDHFRAGYGTAWIYTSRRNVPSQKGILRAGFGRVAMLRALRVGCHYYCVGRPNPGKQFPEVEKLLSPIPAPLHGPTASQTTPTETGAAPAVGAGETPAAWAAAAASGSNSANNPRR
jgi:RimJ/RimL family protein N-acetyltransferase